MLMTMMRNRRVGFSINRCHFWRVSQYNSKHVPTPKVALVDWKPNPPISWHCHQHELRPAIPDINCTDPVSTNQQLHLSDILYSLYSNVYYLNKPPQLPNPNSPYVTHDSNDSIKTVLSPESITPQITSFSNGCVNQVPVSQSSLD